jgi:hypothetical protein
MKYSGTFGYGGIAFEVEGDYTPYRAGTAYNKRGDPGDASEGGGFEEFDILINGVSVYELLRPSVVNALEELAAEDAARETAA